MIVEQMTMTFDYTTLAPSDLQWLTQTETEITVLMLETQNLAQRYVMNILQIGERLAEVKERLRHNKAGGFEGWYTGKGWKKTHVYRYLSAWEQFGNRSNLEQFDIAPSALFALSARSVPETARIEAIERAQQGEAITHTVAQQIIVPRTLQQIREQHADLFFRLSAHGWDSIGKPRLKGITTFISFRHGGTGDENELAEGELPYWLEQLDDSKARREAQRKPIAPPTPDPAFADLQQRGETFGFTLHQRADGYELFRDGKRYSLTADLAPVAETIRIFEEGAAKRAAQAAPVELPTTPPLTTYEAFDAVIDAWQRQRSAAAGLVWLCCLSPEQRAHNERLSAVLYGWSSTADQEQIAAVLAEAETQIALPPLAKVDRAAFEAEVRDALEFGVLDMYPLIAGMLKAVARYAAVQEVV
jgi:hypothetical protein